MLVHHYIPYRRLEKATLFRGSLSGFNPDWFRRHSPDVLFHMARLGGRTLAGRYLAARRGRKANIRLIGHLAALEKPPVVVYVSGSLMYGNQPDGLAVRESSPLAPAAYARQYFLAEEPWLTDAAAAGLEVKMVRPGWIVGPGSWFRVFYWDYYLRNGKVPVYGEGNQLMSLIHVEDLAAMISRVPHLQPACFNLYAGEPVTQAEFTRKLASILGVSRVSISLDEVRARYGRAAAEALGSSIPLGTEYPDSFSQRDFRYPDTESMLRHTVGILKSEQGILPKAPEWGAAEPIVSLP